MNNWVEIMIFALCILLLHIIALSTQALSGKQYFYGVYVKNIEIDEHTKKNLHKAYKRRLNIYLILVILLFELFGVALNINPGLNIALSILIYVGFMTINLKKSYDEVKLIKNEYLLTHEDAKSKKKFEIIELVEDEKLLVEKAKIRKKFTVLYGLCISLSFISLIYVASKYSSLPDIIITHWGGAGRPDGFSEKNIFNVFFTNIIDILMVILLAYIAIGTLSARVYIDKSIEVNRKKAIKYLNGMGYSFLCLILSLQSMTTTIPIFMVRQSNIPIALIIFGCITIKKIHLLWLRKDLELEVV